MTITLVKNIIKRKNYTDISSIKIIKFPSTVIYIIHSSSIVTIKGDQNATWFPSLPVQVHNKHYLIFSPKHIVFWTSIILPNQSQHRMFTCLTFFLDAHIEGCALCHLFGIGSLILSFLAGFGCGDYGFRMSYHLKYSQVPAGLK